jgi:hypothetical protein
LRQLFQDDCGLIKDWGAPLNSPRKEFKNTSQSVDPLTLNIAITTWDDVPGDGMYPTTLSTPSESGLSPLHIGSILEIEPLPMQFAGLEDNRSIEAEGSWVSGYASASPRLSGNTSSMDYSDAGMKELVNCDEDIAYSPTPLYTNDQDLPIADSRNESAYHELGTPDNAVTDWELLFNSDPMSNVDYQEQVLGSPIYWGEDPGASDVALD